MEELCPEIEIIRTEGMGLRLEEVGRGGGLALVEEGGIAHGVGEAAGSGHADLVAPQRLADIGVDDVQPVGDAIAPGVLLADERITGSDLHPGHLDARTAGEQAECGDAGANAGLEDAVARLGRHGGGEEDRINAGAEALLGLQDAEAAAEEAVFGEAGRNGAVGCVTGLHLADFATFGLASRYQGRGGRGPHPPPAP
jgi:hypothetical protein